jgi:hypothetical protein
VRRRSLPTHDPATPADTNAQLRAIRGIDVHTKILELVKRETSGARAMTHVSEIVRHHRIQSSPGLRAAAAYCAEQLGLAGLDSKVQAYPYDGARTYWTSQSFEEWDASLATLDLTEPAAEARRLCDYDEMKISVIQRSGPTPPGGVVAELVVVDAADREESYQNVDVRGKLVLVRGDIEAIRQQAIVKHGAAGLVSDFMMEFPPVRTRMDIPDARQYTSFWWAGIEDDKCFGFVLSPKQGEWLRALVRRENAAGRKVMLRAEVRSRFYSGAIDNAEGLIPGAGHGEVVVVAHLCHPQASANDNASGCAAAVEAARVLAKLIADGKLPRPQRAIRFLLPPEFAGTYAFLSQNEGLIPGMVAAINLDMVGESQELCGSSFLVEKPPRAIGSFAGDLAELILDSIAQEVGNLASTSKYALFRHAVTPFSGGSDHYVFSDPTVGVPCPMLIQWPDKFYHTSADTLDKVDPASLARAAVLTATYAYFLAAAGTAEVTWLAGEMAGLFAAECAVASRRLLASGADAELARRKLGFLRDCKAADLDSLRRLLPPEGAAAAAEAIAAAKARLGADLEFTLAHCERTLPGCQAGEATREPSRAADGRRPRRTFRGPIGRRELFIGMDASTRQAWIGEMTAYLKGTGKELAAVYGMMSSAIFWTDGTRTMSQLAELVELDTGWCDPGALARIYDLLTARGWIEWV